MSMDSPSEALSAELEEHKSQESAQAGKYLTFNLASEQYGIEILRVREIIGLMNVTPVPGSPSYIRGVINLRGKIFPVMELRKRFELELVEDQDRNCIIVVEILKEGAIFEMGLLVDAVSEVMNITAEEIEPAPEFGGQVDNSYIFGLAKSGSEVKILLDIEKIVLEGNQKVEEAQTAVAS